MFVPLIRKNIHGGTQNIYRFPNNYGASVVCHNYSYGGDQGLWEVAVLLYNEEGEWDFCYSTPITSDVIGYCDEDEVRQILTQISQLQEPEKE